MKRSFWPLQKSKDSVFKAFCNGSNTFIRYF